MFAVISLLVIISLSLLITRVGTISLSLTGISKELAFFQAFSAFSGVGYTTMESEKVVNQPVRRRILMTLMLAGNVGVVTAVSSLILTFVQVETPSELLQRVLILIFGVLVLFLLASTKWFDRLLSALVGWGLRRWTRMDIYDYDSLLQMSDGYAVSEVEVHETDWLANKTLAVLNLSQEGILVLGIRRVDGSYVGSPTGHTSVLPHDVLIAYGRYQLLGELGRREGGKIGEGAHRRAMAQQRKIIEQQEKMESPRNSANISPD